MFTGPAGFKLKSTVERLIAGSSIGARYSEVHSVKATSQGLQGIGVRVEADLNLN